MWLTIRFKSTYFFWFLFLFLMLSCTSKISKSIPVKEMNTKKEIITGADQPDIYLKDIGNKKIGIVSNQTSILEKNRETIHLVDFLYKKIPNQLLAVFAPEHGFRGKADAGEHINNEIDEKTKLPIISLYGKNKKPTKEQLKGIELMIFDIQDVGVRFYTYISTLHYIMEACAENNIKLLVLDRPNPNAHYIDGPFLEKKHESFVGMHPVPLVYGMTIGEYAKMINGENWLQNNQKCNLEVIRLQNYSHQNKYDLPVNPSPNLPNATSVNLYPSLAFFEGTNVSCGRGTNMQFQIFGSPFLSEKKFPFRFTPKPNLGAKYPKHNGKICYGKDLRKSDFLKEINLNWLIKTYKNTKNKSEFFNPFFTKLAGTKKLQKQIESDLTEKQIKNSWQEDLKKFKEIRKKYLLYN